MKAELLIEKRFVHEYPFRIADFSLRINLASYICNSETTWKSGWEKEGREWEGDIRIAPCEFTIPTCQHMLPVTVTTTVLRTAATCVHGRVAAIKRRQTATAAVGSVTRSATDAPTQQMRCVVPCRRCLDGPFAIFRQSQYLKPDVLQHLKAITQVSQ
ncbi:hypothetical protein Tcan_00299 [Toxocara canis]|uniref:Uncharacterized protein n=1 Tax=Toxocara canis TaxID=6265 RepID=A0A0B2VJ48_TOXCA|nr:hypothetical protein Tcan_00299 [Toxocara canis]